MEDRVGGVGGVGVAGDGRGMLGEEWGSGERGDSGEDSTDSKTEVLVGQKDGRRGVARRAGCWSEGKSRLVEVDGVGRCTDSCVWTRQNHDILPINIHQLCLLTWTSSL